MGPIGIVFGLLLVFAVGVYVGYEQGIINGEERGCKQVIEEDIIRVDAQRVEIKAMMSEMIE